MKITRKIRRELHLTCTEGRYRGNSIICTLLPGDTIQFRIKGTQQTFEISLGHCYNLAQKMTADRINQQRFVEWQKKKKDGIAAKRPKPINLHLSRIYR